MLQNLINWFPVPSEKVWRPMIYTLVYLNFFSTESGPHEIHVCKCGLQKLNEFDTPDLGVNTEKIIFNNE